MCFKFGGCFPAPEKTDSRSKRSAEYFSNFNRLCAETIDDLLKKQANNALPYKMILNHELINSNGRAKKIYRIFTNDPEKKKYQGVGWVVTSCVPHCMICREDWSSFIIPNHCYACGNAVCQTFCATESAALEGMTELGPVRVCKLCHWGQEVAGLHKTFRPLSMVDYGHASPAGSDLLLPRRTTTIAESDNNDSIIDLTSYSIEDQAALVTKQTLPKIVEESHEEEHAKVATKRPSATTTTVNPLTTGTATAAANTTASTTTTTTTAAGGNDLVVTAAMAAAAASVIVTNTDNTNTTTTTANSSRSTSADGSTDSSASTAVSTKSTDSPAATTTDTGNTTTTNPMLVNKKSPSATSSPTISPSSSSGNLLSAAKVQPQINQLIKEIPKPPRVKTGWLKISTNNGISWKRRFCTIQNGYLSYYANDSKDSLSNKSASSAAMNSPNNNNNNNKLKGQICLAGYRYQLPSEANKVSLRIDLFYEEEDGQLRLSNSDEMDVLIETIDHVERDAWVQAITAHTDYIEKIHLHDRLVEEEIEHITFNNTSRNAQTNYP